ncbi:MAG: hypothetical protein NTZ94_16445 [Verrucomicrobia bacterium]|nr:hypothetical protein [Verrucomicrobiota bacterium]
MSAPTIEKLAGEVAETNHGFWKLLILGEIELNNLLERILGGECASECLSILVEADKKIVTEMVDSGSVRIEA